MRQPGRVAAAELACHLRRLAVSVVRRMHDGVRPTYANDNSPSCPLLAFAPALDSRRVARLAPDLAVRCGRYLEQRFDLLGSGWRTITHGAPCAGFEGHRYEAPPTRPDAAGSWLAGQVSGPNLAPARAVWRLLDPGYHPIDWHRDFRSGYRWSPLCWYRMVPYGHLPGVDVKVPWELARMQHLPQLALAFGCARAGLPRFLPSDRYRDAFRNHVLDFVATNPPRYGVNWRSTMEVAIRIANWLLAHDLFRAYGAEWDSAFEGVFVRSVETHGRHIAGNLEYSPVRRNNHYLANLAGLIFVAAYLSPTAETERWWRVAVPGLAGEIANQFLADGGHFEASTSYHALAAELVAYAIAMIFAKRRGGPRAGRAAPDGTLDGGLHSVAGTLHRMGEFLIHMTRPDGRLAQIGDHDSGRLFKVQPRPSLHRNPQRDGASPQVIDEEHLAAGHAVAAINGLLGRADFKSWCDGRWLNESLVTGLAGEIPWRLAICAAAPRALEVARSLRPGFETLCKRLRAAQALDSSRVVLAAPGASLLAGLQAFAYPDFGVYVFRSRRLFLCLRAGFGCHDGTGGHAHADQLALEASVDGVGWIQDPGSYVYTPSPKLRNRYRASSAHFVPYLLEDESRLWRSGLFDLSLDVQVREVATDCNAVAVDLVLEGNRLGQVVTIEAQEVVVETCVLERSKRARLLARCRPGHAGRYLFRGAPMSGSVRYSPGYGLTDVADGRGS